MRQKFGQVLGKYSGLFQRVSPIRDRSVHFYARGHGKSVLPSMRLVLSTVSRPGNGQALCFCPSFRRLDQSHTGLVVHYRARETKDRTIKHLRVFHVCTMNSRAHRHVRHVWESMLPSWVKNIRYISHDVSRIRLIRRHETTKRFRGFALYEAFSIRFARVVPLRASIDRGVPRLRSTLHETFFCSSMIRLGLHERIINPSLAH